MNYAEIEYFIKKIIDDNFDEYSLTHKYNEDNKILYFYAFGNPLIKITFLKNSFNLEITCNNKVIKIKVNNLLEGLSEIEPNIKTRYEELLDNVASYSFGCCSRYLECSEAGKCVNQASYTLPCYYRKNLREGKIFYGESKTNKDN